MNNTYNKIINALERAPTIEKIIESLRGLDFRFVEAFTFGTGYPFKESHQKYSWLIRKVSSKKWDTTLMVGIKMWGKKTNKVVIYYDGKWLKTLRTPWKDKADINFRKLVVKLKFPDYLNYDERRKWRTEYHKQLRTPTRKPSAWYLEHEPNVQKLG